MLGWAALTVVAASAANDFCRSFFDFARLSCICTMPEGDDAKCHAGFFRWLRVVYCKTYLPRARRKTTAEADCSPDFLVRSKAKECLGCGRPSVCTGGMTAGPCRASAVAGAMQDAGTDDTSAGINQHHLAFQLQDAARPIGAALGGARPAVGRTGSAPSAGIATKASPSRRRRLPGPTPLPFAAPTTSLNRKIPCPRPTAGRKTCRRSGRPPLWSIARNDFFAAIPRAQRLMFTSDWTSRNYQRVRYEEDEVRSIRSVAWGARRCC